MPKKKIPFPDFDIPPEEKSDEKSGGGTTNVYISDSTSNVTPEKNGNTSYLYFLLSFLLFGWAVAMTVLYVLESSDNESSSTNEVSTGESSSRLRTLQVIHASDNESGFQDSNNLEEKVIHYSALVEGLYAMGYASIHVTAGDLTLPGPFYQASAEVEEWGSSGMGDMKILSAMHLDANCIGNHELDGGIVEFATFLAAANFPMVSANLDFSQVEWDNGVPLIQFGDDGSECMKAAGKVVKSCYVETNVGRVGIVGRSPADFFQVTPDIPGLDFVGGRDPDTSQPIVAGATLVQEQVDFLTAQGIDIVILLDHSQDFTTDPISPGQLSDVDIIVTAGSTGFFAQSEAFGPFNNLREGDEAVNSYPLTQTDSDGLPILIVNSAASYSYIGNLMVSFDESGSVVSWDGRSGPISATEESVDAFEAMTGTQLAASTDVMEYFTKLQETATISDSFTVVGVTVNELNGVRADVRSRETNLAQLVTDSTLWYGNLYAGDNDLPSVDIALKNGGGIRDTILGPSITRLAIRAALAFDNHLAIVEISACQLLAAMENAASRIPELDGRFPHVAGMNLEINASLPPILGSEETTCVFQPSRVTSLIVTTSAGAQDVVVDDSAMQGDVRRTFVVATNDFLLTGGDGYFALGAGTFLAETDIGEQQILEDYVSTLLQGSVFVVDPPVDPRLTVVGLETSDEV